jgi:FdrA protein
MMAPTFFDKLIHSPLVVINLGLKMFADSLEEQKVEVVQVDWIPPAGGDKEVIDLLDQLL